MQAKQYRTNLRRLHHLIYKGHGKSTEASRIRHCLSVLWERMPKEEQEDARKLAHNLHVFAQVKRLLKSLAAEQKEAKAARSLSNRDNNPRFHEYADRHRRLTVTGNLIHFWIEHDIDQRKARITALTNLYHELRGSKHQHGVSDGAKFYYVKARQEYGERFKISPRNLNKPVDASVLVA
ncbi:hypothetical protein LCGC14_0331640 [marine sediment metagenome]|uniref:Uncharacterized protein n=1 Tax=marine sediment metagenome TaxID=412755 RepID=A0A0F9TG06_9ZZZZ